MGDEESGGNSVATSSATPLINWWDVHATSSLSSWNTTLHSNSSSCCEDHHLSAPSSDNNHLWTHVLLGDVGSNEEVQNSGETNLMEEVSCKSIMYEPACNYLKQLDTTWDYNHHNNHSSSSSINSTNTTTTFDHRHLHNNNGFNDESAVLESDERLSKLVTTWSIAPPHQTHHNTNTTHFDPSHDDNTTDQITLSSCMDHSGVFSSYAAHLDMKVKQDHHQHQHASLSEGIFGYHQNNNSNIGFNNNNSHHHQNWPARNWTDVISFTGTIGRPIIGIHALKPSFRPPSSSLMTTSVSDHSKKQLFHTSSLPTRASNGRRQGSSTTEVKKKRTDDSSSQAILKKPKQDTSSTASSTKVQAPKVKLGDRITTLQQIVSPFGKTDTASVLFEAIGYIKFLQEQVQLLSNSYMKTNSHRETAWGSMDRKEEKGDLKSRGLCLVPISWTPQSYRDNSAPDYWTPAYRGCLFR